MGKDTENNWLTEELSIEVRKVFEPRFKKTLSDCEVFEIAQSLTVFMKTYCVMKYKNESSVNTKHLL